VCLVGGGDVYTCFVTKISSSDKVISMSIVVTRLYERQSWFQGYV
jgi:hypothetical protein